MKRFVVAAVTSSFLLAPAAFAGGKELFEKKCGRCHSTSKTTVRTGNKADWQALVQSMQKKRSNFISDKEAGEIVDYLTATYGKK